jgi:nitroimidazol reductase NimA-like FMN-containing flavoprotein (pyridoxamine 5'-phosphate oxidase superfamily)/GNAT superfamily N-acetyltransferase
MALSRARPRRQDRIMHRPRTALRRHPERAVSDRAALYAVLDQSLVVHVGCATERGPLVLPMAFGRRGDRLYLHGAAGNGLLAGALAAGEVCVTATLVDGLVLAPTALNHSMNYRSVVAFGRLVEVVDAEEQRAALAAVLDHVAPGRAAEVRPPNDAELRATRVVAFDLDEASVKMRVGPPRAGAEPDAPSWAGVVPLAITAGAPHPAGPRPLAASVARAVLARTPGRGARQLVDGFELDGDPTRLDLATLLTWLRDQSYWAQDLDEGRLVRSLLGSVVVGAYAGGAQIGFARAVTDLETFAWLADVYVAPAARGRGVATAMARWLIGLPELARLRKWMLGTRDAHDVYRRVGFVDAPRGRFMVREERPPF